MIIVFTTPNSLPELATNLARSAADGGLGCWSALNLDGGPSTQLSVATPALTLEVEGGWGVPNGLAISGSLPSKITSWSVISSVPLALKPRAEPEKTRQSPSHRWSTPFR